MRFYKQLRAYHMHLEKIYFQNKSDFAVLACAPHCHYRGGMNAERFNDFLRDARLNLNPDDQVIFIYDGAPAHRNPENPGPNTELKKLPPYSPFLNI